MFKICLRPKESKKIGGVILDGGKKWRILVEIVVYGLLGIIWAKKIFLKIFFFFLRVVEKKGWVIIGRQFYFSLKRSKIEKYRKIQAPCI